MASVFGSFDPTKSRMKVVLSVRVGVSGVLCHLDPSTDTTGHDDGWCAGCFVSWIHQLIPLDMMMFGGYRVLCHVDSLMVTLDLISDIYIQW